MEIRYTKYFVRRYKKLPQEVKKTAEEKEQIFRKDPFDLSLKTHKLSGKLKGLQSFSINHSYRIVFEVKDSNIFIFHLVGNHNIYK